MFNTMPKPIGGSGEGGKIPASLIGKTIGSIDVALSGNEDSNKSSFLVYGVSEISYNIAYINANLVTVYGVDDDDNRTVLQTQTTTGTFTVDVSGYNRVLFAKRDSATTTIGHVTIVS